MDHTIASEAANLSGTVILIADDSEAIRARWASLLRRIPGVGCVERAVNAQEVWACMDRHSPGIALIDLHLSGGGIDLFKQLKADYPGVRLLALSYYAGWQMEASLRTMGVDACFDKCMQIEAAIQAIQTVLKQDPPHPERRNGHESK